MNRSSSVNLRNLISKGKLPDHLLEKLDLDRICEQEEDFLNTDRKRQLALNKGTLKPKILAVKQQIHFEPNHSITKMLVKQDFSDKLNETLKKQETQRHYVLENRSIVGNNHEYNVAIMQHQVKHDAKLNLTKNFSKSMNAAKAKKKLANRIGS